MAKMLNLKAPESMDLRKMEPSEIEKYVVEMAERAFEQMPEGVKPVGINAVSLSQEIEATELEPGAGMMWERVCFKFRSRIEDFTDPVAEEFEREDSPIAGRRPGTRLESQMRIQTYERPTEDREG